MEQKQLVFAWVLQAAQTLQPLSGPRSAVSCGLEIHLSVSSQKAAYLWGLPVPAEGKDCCGHMSLYSDPAPHPCHGNLRYVLRYPPKTLSHISPHLPEVATPRRHPNLRYRQEWNFARLHSSDASLGHDLCWFLHLQSTGHKGRIQCIWVRRTRCVPKSCVSQRCSFTFSYKCPKLVRGRCVNLLLP